MRLKDLHDPFAGTNWEGVDKDIIGFRDALYKKFPSLKITSAKRNWGAGRHQAGQAIDIASNPEIQKFLYSSEGDSMLRQFNLGFLDETLEHNMKKTGATGPHFHIGKDSTLKGNQYHGNTAFSRNLSSTTSNEDSTDKVDIQEQQNVNNAYGQSMGLGNQEFLQKTLQQQLQLQNDLAKKYEEEKAYADRQNAIQEELKSKMIHQAKMVEMIQGHELEMVKRNNFAEGGEFDGLNDNLDFKMQQILDSMPQYEQINPEDSETFRQLEYVNNNIKLITDSLSRIPEEGTSIISAPTEQNSSVNTPETIPEKTENLKTSVKISNTLKGLGLNNYQIAGVLGSLAGESSVMLNSKAVNPTSKAFGIAQWLGSRLTGLKNFAKQGNKDYTSEDTQIDFLLHELTNTSEKSVLNTLRKTKNLEEATLVWTRNYERPSEREIKNSIRQRINYAQKFLTEIS